MEFDYIYLKNFRQYKDVKIDFSNLTSAKFTIIQGSNGAGKTNLLNAITWCLFNKEFHIDKKYEGLPIVNTTTLVESKDKIVSMKVDIQMIQNDGKRILISREHQYKKDKNNEITEITHKKSFYIMRERDRDWIGPISGDDAQFIINNMIPPSIENYFFFDGERMDAYFKENTGDDIRKAVFEISQLELFEKLITHLTSRRNANLKSAKGLSSKADEIKELLDIQNRSFSSDKEELGIINSEKNDAERLENEYSALLRNSSLEHIQDIEDKRNSLNIDIEKLKKQITDLEDDRIKLLHKSMPIIFLSDALNETKNLINGRREAGLIPPLYQTIFIEKLLSNEVCLCGSDISDKDEFSLARRNKVASYLIASELSDMSSELIEANIQIHEMLNSVSEFNDMIITLEKRLRVLNEMKDDKNLEVKKISQEILQSNVVNIKNWEKERDKYKRQKDSKIGIIAILEKQIKRRENIIRAYNSQLKRELKKEEKNKELLNILSFCDEGIKCAKDIKEKIMINIKNEIEIKTSEQFLSLIWKKETYTDVKIKDNYNISVPHISGREGIGTLSAGERQVCALSFMAALNSVSGFEAPIIIDTPLARISNEPSKNIALNLPNYLKGKQVTLLVTEKEYSDEVKKALSKVVGKNYVINVIEKEHGNLAEVELIK